MNKLTRKLDRNGVVSLPFGILKELGLKPGDLISMNPIAKGIRLEKIENPFDLLAENANAQHKKKKSAALLDIAKRKKIPLEMGKHVLLSHLAQDDLSKLGGIMGPVLTALSRLEVGSKGNSSCKGRVKNVLSLEISIPGIGLLHAAYMLLSDKKTCLVFMIGSKTSFQRKAERRVLALFSSRPTKPK